MPVERRSTLFWVKVNEIIEMMLDEPEYMERRRLMEFVERIKAKYEIGQRQAYRMLKEAREELLQIKKRDVEKNLDRALTDREYLLRKAKKDLDNKFALEVMKDRDRLLGLYVERSKADISLRSVDMGNFTDHGLERLARGEDIAEVMQDPLSHRLALVRNSISETTVKQDDLF
jgi:hypothetical protein